MGPDAFEEKASGLFKNHTEKCYPGTTGMPMVGMAALAFGISSKFE